MNPMHITFGIYLVAVLGVGVIAYFSTRNFDDYILGGRSLGSYVTAMSAGASDMSGWLLLGLPGAIFASGLGESWIGIGLCLGAYMNWILVAGRLRVHTEVNHNSLTLPEYFQNRFAAKTPMIKIVSAAIILFFFAIYCASGIVSGARLFEYLFHVTYTQAMWLSAAATIIYVFIGGFLAVSWTDTIQATLMIFALILTPIMVYLSLGGADEVRQAIHHVAQAKGNLPLASFVDGVSAITIISALCWGLGYFGQPHILVRFMAIRDVKEMKQARRIGMTWMILCLLGAILVGYFGIAYFGVHPDKAGVFGTKEGDEKVFIVLTDLLFNPWLAGVILSAILAAVMSTLSCQLLLCSSAITEDFYKGLFRPKACQKELVWIGRIMVLVVAVIAILIARNPESKVLDLVSYAWAGFGAAFGPIVILSVFSRRITEVGAFSGMIAGAVVVVLWKWLGTHYDFEIFKIYEILPGFIACGLVAVWASYLTKVPQEVLDRFVESDRIYQSSK